MSDTAGSTGPGAGARRRTACPQDRVEALDQADPLGEADAPDTVAGVDDALASFAAALGHFSRALALAREHGDRLLESNALNGAATVHRALADHRTAAELYLESLALKLELGDRRTASGCLGNLGLVYQEMGDFAAAADLHRQSLEITRELGDRQAEATALGNLGVDHFRMGEHAEAVACHEQALAIARAIGNRQTEAGCLEHLGLAYEALGDLTEALALHEASLETHRALGNRLGEAGSLVQVARVRARLGGPDRALAELRNARALAEEVGARRTVVDASLALADVHEQLGDAVAALRCARSAAERERELLAEQRERSTAALLAGFRVERALHEARIERLRSVELSRALESLRRADDERTRLLEQLRSQAAELERLASEDSLTGLRNRRTLEDGLEELFAEARERGIALTVAVVDVDGFKAINDLLGHRIGDEVLRRVAALLRRRSRGRDVVARYGGDEFVAVFCETELVRGHAAVERVRRAVEHERWDALAPGLAVTVSAGLADASEASSPERLLALADERLSEAKRAGRNRVRS
jgi:diguanylate cyclase (GGDEF)-like protein